MEAPVSVSLGVIRSLPAKLEGLLSPEADHGLHNGEKSKIRLLNDHLQELMDKYLMEPSSEVEGAPTSMARCWHKEVRELSYDIDDFIDELVHGLKASAASNNSLRGKIAKVRKGRSRSRWVAEETSRFRSRLEEAIQRHKRYNLDKLQGDTNRIDSDEPPIVPPLYGMTAARPVGIHSSMEKLEEWLSDGEQGLRVVSIVGFGGIGKTTIARELYSTLRRQFECRAFAQSSRKPDVRRLLTSILLQVRRRRLPNDLEMGNLTETIRAYLQHKKYLIIIDDLWDSSTWDIVHRALPDDKCCSRVVTVTENDIVAQRCCGHNSKYIFYMEPLSHKDSSELFFSRFVRNESRNSEEFDKVSSEIVKKCGGFPLATIAAASILARQKEQTEHCIYISKSLSSNLRTNVNIEGMKQVLSLCYATLPDHLKACMLYLSIYKEGHIIRKDDLVKQWIAEGFICAKRGKHVDEVAGSYFDELVNGGMIQPVDMNYNGEVISCTVHYMVLNLIRYRCIEENFVTAIDDFQTNTRLADKVRRLSLQFNDVDEAESPSKLRLSQLRSLVFFGLLKSLPPMGEFRLLRVLILHLWGDRDNIGLDLTTVCKFFRLRNLDISCNVTLNLQIQLHGLEHLETLKIDSRVSEIPHDIILSTSLLHLSLPGDINLPNGIGRLTSLCTLGCFDLSRNSADNVQSLGELKNVRDLHLTCSTMPCDNLEVNVGYLASVLSKLSNLRSLNLSPRVSSDANTMEATASSNTISFDGLDRVSSAPSLLEKLEFSPRICIFPRLPLWTGALGKLTILKIAVTVLWQSDIDILGRLNALSTLSLYVRTAPAERIVFHKEGFTVLSHFKFICSALCVAFKKEAMPNIRRIKLGFSAKALEQCSLVDAGFKNLTSLEVLAANVGNAGSDESVRNDVQSALEKAFNECGTRPIINVQLVQRTFYGDNEISTENFDARQYALFGKEPLEGFELSGLEDAGGDGNGGGFGGPEEVLYRLSSVGEESRCYRSGVCQDIRQTEHLFHLYMTQRGIGTTDSNEKFVVKCGFGSIAVDDFAIRDGPAPNANLVGRARGMHVADGMGDDHWLFCHSIMFTDTRFKGSSLKMFGDFGYENDAEWAIVGGTGEFAYANGAVTAKVIQTHTTATGRIWDLRIRAFCSCIPEKIMLAPSEIIKQVLGTTSTVGEDTVVTSLTLVSNLTTYGPFGTTNGTPFCSQAPESNRSIAGFYARAGEAVNALGVYYTPEN